MSPFKLNQHKWSVQILFSMSLLTDSVPTVQHRTNRGCVGCALVGRRARKDARCMKKILFKFLFLSLFFLDFENRKKGKQAVLCLCLPTRAHSVTLRRCERLSPFIKTALARDPPTGSRDGPIGEGGRQRGICIRLYQAPSLGGSPGQLSGQRLEA